MVEAAFYALWRRWFGGGFKNTWLGNNRAVQCVVFLASFTGLMYLHTHYEWWICVLSAAFLYCQFWARGHGACFDIGRGQYDETTIKRYNARWYHVPCDWLLKNNKYGFLYDFLYMGLRYTCPMILFYALGCIPLLTGSTTPLFTPWVIAIGASVSPLYALCWTLKEREDWLFQKHWSVSGATNLAEYLAGFVFGLIFWVGM